MEMVRQYVGYIPPVYRVRFHDEIVTKNEPKELVRTYLEVHELKRIRQLALAA